MVAPVVPAVAGTVAFSVSVFAIICAGIAAPPLPAALAVFAAPTAMVLVWAGRAPEPAVVGGGCVMLSVSAGDCGGAVGLSSDPERALLEQPTTIVKHAQRRFRGVIARMFCARCICAFAV
jgi:hypothetical protein